MPMAFCLYLVMCASIFMFLSTFVFIVSAFIGVCWDESKHIGRQSPSFYSLYTRVYLHINAYCCESIDLNHVLVCANIYTLAFTCAHLLVKDCMYLCAPPPKFLHFLVCALMKMVAFFRVRLHQNVVSFISTCLHQNGCLSSRASTSKCFAFYRARTDQNVLL